MAPGSNAFVATSCNAASSGRHFALAGAFSRFGAASNRANQLGGAALELDSSDSPNADKRLWVVALSSGSRGDTNRWRIQFRSHGIRDAYVADLCFYVE